MHDTHRDPPDDNPHNDNPHADARDLDTELNAALDAAADEPDFSRWKPEVGEQLIGIVTARDEVTSKFSDTPDTRLIVERGDGATITVLASPKMLKRLVAEKDPQVGDRIAIRRMPTPPGKSHHAFRVIVKRGDLPF
jgi:hypothetical protein